MAMQIAKAAPSGTSSTRKIRRPMIIEQGS
jgi:hypothetical protein